MSVEEYRAVLSRLENVADRLEGAGGAPSTVNGAASPSASHEHVIRFDDVLDKFKSFQKLSLEIGGDVLTKHTDMVSKAFNLNREFIIMSTQCKPPADDKVLANLSLLKELSKVLGEVNDFRERNRANKDYFNHLSAISESISALGWVTVKPTPAPHVKEMADAAIFYTNRILRDYKEKDSRHAEWTKAWISILKELEDYIKKYHTTGLSWNRNGRDAATYKCGPTTGPPAGKAPPPPPPPTVEQLQKLEISSKSKPSPAGDRDNLFKDLQKGEGITAHLRKVDRSQMTHKNPELRAGSVVKSDDVKKGSSSPKKAWAPVPASKPPIVECQGGKKWIVEYQSGNAAVVLDNVNMKQTVYIFKCENSTVQVKGKINSITLDSCKKVGVVYDDVVSTVDIVNCQSVQVQSQGIVPTIAVAKTDGCQVYLSEKSLDAEIVTSKSSEMNVLVPSPNGFDEFPVPEQFKTTFDGKKLITSVTDSV